MDEKRKKLLCDILAEADKMRIEKTWPVSEDELKEHSGIRDSYEFGFLCGYFNCKEQMIKSAVDSCAYISDFKLVVPVCLPFGNKQRIHDCDNVRVIIIKEE